MRRASVARLTVVAVVMLAGCTKPAGDTAPSASAPSASGLATALAASASASAALAVHPMKDYTDPPPDRIGVLAPGTHTVSITFASPQDFVGTNDGAASLSVVIAPGPAG